MSQLEELLNRLEILERKTNYLRDPGIGRIPGDLEGLGTPIFYILAFGGIVIIGSTIISTAVSIYNGIVSKKSK
jgi:hypothetical protein